MRHLRRLAAGLVALFVVAGCTTDLGTPAERLTAAAQEAGIPEVSRVDADYSTVWLSYLDGDTAMIATKLKNNDVTKAAAAQVGDPLVTRPLAELGLDSFSQRLADVADSCNEGRFGGRVLPTIGGAVVQQIGCADWQFSQVYVDDQQLSPITSWDESSLDRVLAEVRAVHGAQSSDLLFSTPGASAANASYSLYFVSAEQTNPAGETCRFDSWRHGESGQDRPLLSYATCIPTTVSLSDADFELEQVTGAKILAALTSGADKLGIGVEQIGDFTIYSAEGRLKVQMRPASGVPAKVPLWAEEL